VGRTLLSVAFDFDPDVDFDLDVNWEGHGFKPCRKAPPKWNPASAAEANCLQLRVCHSESG
jgi:hypothetical protein